MRTFDVPPAFPVWLKPAGRNWWVGPEHDDLTFAVKEAAQIFFNRSASWLRGQFAPKEDPEPDERHPMGYFTEADVTVPLMINTVQSEVASYEYRRFTLNNVEQMLWSQYLHDQIENVWWYTHIEQTGKRGEHRLMRYNQMMEGSQQRLESGLEVVKAIARVRGYIPRPS